jgi:hypothetical protein
MARTILAAGSIAVLILGSLTAEMALAQQGRSTTGTSSMGMGLGSSMGTTGMGSGMGMMGMGSGMGSMGMGSMGMGSMGMGGMSGFGATGSTFGGGSAFGSGMMGGGTGMGYGALMQQQPGYAGFGQTGTTGMTGRTTTTMGRTTTGRATGGAARGGQAGRMGQTGTTQAQNTAPAVPIRLQVGFDAPRATGGALTSSVQTKLSDIAAVRRLGRPQVSVEGGVVVLTGTAPTESQRMLIQTIVSQQPGVSAIRNEIVIAPEDGSSEPDSDN